MHLLHTYSNTPELLTDLESVTRTLRRTDLQDEQTLPSIERVWRLHDRLSRAENLGYHNQPHVNGPPRMYYTTGFSRDEIVDLCAMINTVPVESRESWPPILGLFKSVVIALTYMRRNRVQCELAETYGVSQSTISRAITVLTPLFGKVLQKYVPTADELDARTQYVVDGTLLPCWSWASHPELYSGKHKTTGMNVQVACTLEGSLAWISDPIDGSRHDTYCLGESEVLLSHDPGNWVGDKGHDPVRYRDLVINPQPKITPPTPPGRRDHPPTMDRPRAARP